jgi:tetratricopeptide (TPR) repeat protein
MVQKKTLTALINLRLVFGLLWFIAAVLFFVKPVQAIYKRSVGAQQLIAGLAANTPDRRFYECQAPLVPGLAAANQTLNAAYGLDPSQVSTRWLMDLMECRSLKEQTDYFATYRYYLPQDPWTNYLWVRSTIKASESKNSFDPEFRFTNEELFHLLKSFQTQEMTTENLLIHKQIIQKYPHVESVWENILFLIRGWTTEENAKVLIDFEKDLIQIQAERQTNDYVDYLYLHSGRLYQSYLKPRDFYTAFDFYQKALSNLSNLSDSQRAFLHMYLGETMRALGEPVSVYQKELLTAVRINSKSDWSLINLGSSYVTMENYPYAEAAYNQAYRLSPQNPWVFIHLGTLFEKQGDLERARQNYRQALDIKPDWEIALQKLDDLDGK